MSKEISPRWCKSAVLVGPPCKFSSTDSSSHPLTTQQSFRTLRSHWSSLGHSPTLLHLDPRNRHLPHQRRPTRTSLRWSLHRWSRHWANDRRCSSLSLRNRTKISARSLHLCFLRCSVHRHYARILRVLGKLPSYPQRNEQSMGIFTSYNSNVHPDTNRSFQQQFT